MIYDVAIIGGGPAGIAGAVYSARKRLQTILIAEEIGGQSSVSDTIFNWIGTPAISGPALAENLKKHAEEYTKDGHTLTMSTGHRVESIEKFEGGFKILLSNQNTITTKTVLVATGSTHRKLTVKGAIEFDHKGIMYCATCDGPIFSGQPVAVAGGGNAALEAVLQLSQYASHVTLIHRSEKFRADEVTVREVEKLENVTILKNTDIKEIKGEIFVNGVVYTDKNTGEEKEIEVGAIFVEIGQIPNTSFLSDIIELTESGHVVIDPRTQRSSTTGIWAAGDCTDGLYHQNNIAAGDAVKAIEDLYIWIKTQQ